MSYDTFWTVSYKGGFISSKRDHPQALGELK